MAITLEELRDFIREKGEHIPKKHGEWRRIHAYDDHYLVLDTWNGDIYHHPNGAEPSSTDNMYRCVYVFYDKNGKVDNCSSVKEHMAGFWYGHIYAKTNK